MAKLFKIRQHRQGQKKAATFACNRHAISMQSLIGRVHHMVSMQPLVGCDQRGTGCVSSGDSA